MPYGRTRHVRFSVPDTAFAGMLEPGRVEPADDPLEAIRQALEHPIGCGRLEEIVRPGQSVNILCDDISRPTPVSQILPVLLEKLHQAGVRDRDIKIVMALGSHRYMTETEKRERVGDRIYQQIQVVNSEFRNPDDLIFLGNAPDGVAHLSVPCRPWTANIASGSATSCRIRWPVVAGEILFPGSPRADRGPFHMQAAWPTQPVGVETARSPQH